MPQYSIPPWIQPADTARQYLSGLQLGSNIARQSQALEQQRERTAMEAEIRQKELERRMAEETQRMMMQKAYHDEVISLREKQLQNEAQRVQAATSAIAAKSAAQQEYQRRVQGGEDPAKVMMELGPGMGMGASMGALLRKKTAAPPGPVEAFPVNLGGRSIPGLVSVPSAGGGMTVRDVPGFKAEGLSSADRTAAANYLKDLKKEKIKALPFKPTLKEDLPKWEAKNKAALDEIASIDQQIKDLLPGLKPKKGSTEAPIREVIRNPKTGRLEVSKAAAAAPAPSTDEDETEDGADLE